MARSKINRKAKANAIPCNKKSAVASGHITPSFLGHRCPQDVQNAINFHRATLTDDVYQFLASNPPNLKTFVEFWSRPQHSSLTTGRAADTICGASWMLALNHLLLRQVDAARAFMLNGAFIHQCAHTSIDTILSLCDGGTVPLCDHIVNSKLPYYNSAFIFSHSIELMEKYLQSVIPIDLMKRMSFASHAGHKSTSATSSWVSDYINCIGNDWGSSSQPKRAIKGIDETSIQITFLETESNEAVHMSIGVSHTLKELFTKYSEERATPLRSLRFVFEGKPLFLSSASNKTPAQLGIRDHDVVCVSSAALSSNCTLSESTSEPQEKRQRKKSNKKRSNKVKRIKPCNAVYLGEEDPKVQHSQALSKLFEEAEPKFRVIRQQLNSLTLERSLPKEKSFKRRTAPSTQEQPVDIPTTEGLVGKAGKSSYVIHVGEVNNLYKSSKKSQAHVPKSQFIDLHGYTQVEASEKLNESLPQWEKYAMEGSYPFVTPVVIVCGGGNQVLAETVSQWIKENNVSNAPKNMFASKSMFASAA